MSSSLCGFSVGYSLLRTMLNSLLPVGIVFYRYVYVCKSNWVLTAYQRKSFNIFLSTLVVGFSLFISSCSVIYREKYVHYIACTGQTHTLTHDQGVAWLLPLGHPFRILSIFAFFSLILLVPLGYYLNYAYRKTQNVRGLNQSTLIAKTKRNIVNVNFDFLVWLTETSSLCLVIPNIGKNILHLVLPDFFRIVPYDVLYRNK